MTNRKMQIIELTLKNIQEKGFTSFSYEHLAKELGVTKASIHYHFEKKGDLGISCLRKIQQGLVGAYTLIKESTMPAEEKPLPLLCSE